MRKILNLLLLMSICWSVNAQKANKDFVDGKLYVKLQTYHNLKTQEAMVPGKRYSANKLPFNLPNPERFGITSVKRAFDVNASPELNATIEISFTNINMADALIAEITKSPLVDYAEKIPIYRKSLDPNDPRYNEQWHLNRISAAGAWNFFSAGSQVVIAIIDDAVDLNHPDLSPNLWENTGEIPNNGIDDDGNGFVDDFNGYDFAAGNGNPNPPSTDFDHGTHVAGIASASTNNATGVAAIGFSCKIMALKATTEAEVISASIPAIIYAANNGADIINMSFGGSTPSTTARNAINYALSQGCILVAAAGNESSTTLSYPASYDGVISVASTTTNDAKSSFSNYGSRINISAPGSNILSTVPFSSYGVSSGTSMASPMVAGLLGLMKSLNPGMPNADLIACLYNSADDINPVNPNFVGQLGVGRINAQRAMQCVSASLNLPPIADFVANNTTVAAGSTVTFSDRSAYLPTSYTWSFPGGTPASASGAVPPPVVYNTPGVYTVTLAVSNTNGSNTRTRTDYITVTEAPTCTRINLPIPETWRLVNYIVGDNAVDGFVNGVNDFGDVEKAMFFNLSATPTTVLTRAFVAFGRANAIDTTKTLFLRIYDGSSDAPGAQLGLSIPINMADIRRDVQASSFSEFEFRTSITLPASKKIFVSVDMSALEWNEVTKDTLSILSNQIGESNTTPIWERQADGLWYQYGSNGSFGVINASLLIHPFVTTAATIPRISPRSPTVCQGESITLGSGASSIAPGTIRQWILEGVNPSVINNEVTVSPFYTVAGTYKAYLLMLGACGEFRIDSSTVLVNPTPDLSIAASKNPICVGETATLTASGATSYSWSPATNLNTTTGAAVQASPSNTTNYTVTGTLGSCTNNAVLELFVRETTASVQLNASEVMITAPTSVTFTAVPNNPGGSPVFNFKVNGTSRQSGASPSFVQTVNVGDVVTCDLTSSEACVTVKTVVSNAIVMGTDPLPVTLFGFSGKRTNSGNQLDWLTATEINSARFEVERSNDGRSFATIGDVAAAGNSTANIGYTYLDAQPLSGKNFYRLKMIDRDGSSAYSNIILLEGGSQQLFTSLYPNPSANGKSAILNITGATRGRLNVAVVNTAGQVVRNYQSQTNDGNLQLTLPVQQLPAGMYNVVIKDGQGQTIETIRWMITR